METATKIGELKIWKRSMRFTSKLYALTKTFPDTEKFGLTSQIRRSAVSVPSNIAEGWGRQNETEFAYFLKISLGSLAEVETQVLLANEFGYLKGTEVKSFTDEIGELYKMTFSFLKALRIRSAKPGKVS